jgi:hypothetical protein
MSAAMPSPDLRFRDLTDWSVVGPNGFSDHRYNDREIIRAFADNSVVPIRVSRTACLRSGTIALEGNHMPFFPKDIHRVGEILAFAAHTEIMPRFRSLTASQVRQKSSPFDLVTDVDEGAEVVITCRLKAAFPDAIVIGEEGATRTPRCCRQSPPPNWPSLSIRSTGPGTSPPTCLYWRRQKCAARSWLA